MQLFLQKYYSTLSSFFNTNRAKNYIGRQFLSIASVIISPPSILSRFLNGKFSKTLLYACVFWLKYSLVKSAMTFFNICLNLDFCSSSKVVTESIKPSAFFISISLLLDTFYIVHHRHKKLVQQRLIH